jgi:hypothetical protein
LAFAADLARKIADSAPLFDYIMIEAPGRIAAMFTESLCATVTQTSPPAQEGLAAFLK